MSKPDDIKNELESAALSALVWSLLGTWWFSTIPGTTGREVAVLFFALTAINEALNYAKVWIGR